MKRHLVVISFLAFLLASTSAVLAQLACGEVVTGTINSAGRTNTYTFSGNAGEVVHLTPSPSSGLAFNVWAELFSPTGTSLGIFGTFGSVTTATLPATGTYTVLVHDEDNLQTGAYSLSLSFVTPKCGTSLTCGQTLTHVLSQPAQVDIYSFSGTAGEVVRLTPSPSSGLAFNVWAELFSPTGTSLGIFGTFGSVTTTNLPANGTYTVLVHDDDNLQMGPYQLTFAAETGCANLTLQSTVVRTQEVACLPLQVFFGSPVTFLSFRVSVPPGLLSAPSLTLGTQFTNQTTTPTGPSEWLITMESSSTNGVIGNQTIGSICFTAISTQSAFAPISLNQLTATNLNGFAPATRIFGGRAVIIANQSLLEATLATDAARMLTLFGKSNTDYAIHYSTNLNAAIPWFPGWTNTLTPSMFLTWPIQSPLSNAPVLLFRAEEL